MPTFEKETSFEVPTGHDHPPQPDFVPDWASIIPAPVPAIRAPHLERPGIPYSPLND